MAKDMKQQEQDRDQHRKARVTGGVLRVLVIGFTGMAAGVLSVLVLCMVRRYGIRDLNKRNYLETSSYADSMIEQLLELDGWLSTVQSFESGNRGGSITSMDSLITVSNASDSDVLPIGDEQQPGIHLSTPTVITYEQFIDNIGSYEYDMASDGTEYLVDTAVDYNANWYSSILLSDYQLRASDSYIVIPASVYKEVAYQMMEPNAVAVGSLNDEELMKVLVDRHYHSSLTRVEDYLDGRTETYVSYESEEDVDRDIGVTEMTTSMDKETLTDTTEAEDDSYYIYDTDILAADTDFDETDIYTEDGKDNIHVIREEYSVSKKNGTEYDTEILNQILADIRNYDEYLYVDYDFSEDSYITVISGKDAAFGFDSGDMTLVYSPYEDKFYSSFYGWYMVPDEMYFLSQYMPSDLSMYFEGAKGNEVYKIGQELPGETLFWLPFADRNSLLRVKLGENYEEYLYAFRNLRNRQQNFVYYVELADRTYGNVNAPEDVMGLNYYTVITKVSRDDIAARTGNGGETVASYYDDHAVFEGDEDSYIYSFSENNHYGYQVVQMNYDNDYLNTEIAHVWTEYMASLSMPEGNSLYLAIRPDYSYSDEFRAGYENFKLYYSYMIPACILTILMLAATVILVLISIKKTGYVAGEYVVYFLDRWPIEVMWLAIFTSLFFMAPCLLQIYNQFTQLMDRGWARGNLIVVLTTCGIYYPMVLLGMTGFLSMIRRLRVKEYQKISIFRVLGGKIYEGIRVIAGQRNLVAQTVELYLAYWLLLIISVFMILALSGVWPFLGLFLFILLHIGMMILAIRKAKGEQMIRTVTQELAEGNLEVEVPKGRPLEVERQILENIEHLGDGLHTALEQSIYDERMKAELITNVSHDIKTPLTSIINYVDLLKREEIDNEEVRHYIEVLDQKSRRLKQLTEDLVEVSKISSGNIELECMPIDLGELVRQSMGEFQDKFEERKLQIVDNISDEPCMIYADGRRTYRVMDNLMQNVYKYATPNTRVYVDLMKSEEMVIFSIKNISQAELNIDSRELMERFIRGDQSRSTEGSGLGLSIAKDLVHMQNGAFDILLDGDLFKVTIMFPVMTTVSEEE